MTPKEKAEELLDNFDLPSGLMTSERKQCALMSVDFMLEEVSNYITIDKWMPPSERVFVSYEERIGFWQQVKEEIKNSL